MRAYLLLILAVTILLTNSNVVSRSSTSLRASQNLIQSRDAAETDSGRVLRAGAKTEETIDPADEERSMSDTGIAKKLGTGVKTWANNKYLSVYMHLKALSSKMDDTVQKFMKKNIDPDQLHSLFKLDNTNNRWTPNGNHMSAEYQLWEKLTIAWKAAHPNWINKLS